MIKAVTRYPGVMCCLLVISTVSAEPAVQINTRFYTVTGHTVEDLHRSLTSRGPSGEDGQPYHAHTEWNLNWHYRWVESRSKCRVSQVEVRVDINYLLPQLDPSIRLPAQLQADWDAYYNALYRHEQQHKDHGIQAARELEQQLLFINEPEDCRQLQSHLQQTAQRVMDKYDRLDKDFDRKTNHGINDGVVFPAIKR